MIEFASLAIIVLLNLIDLKDSTMSDASTQIIIQCPFCSKPLVRGSGQTHCHHCQKELPSEIRALLNKRDVTIEEVAAVRPLKAERESNRGSQIPAYGSPSSAITSETPPVMKRYTDAYRVAQVIVTVGTIIKVVGAVLSVFTWLLVMSLGSFARMGGGSGSDGASIVAFFLAVILGGFVFVLFYIFGVIVSANGQLLKANLDSAVHSSPFLSNEQMAQVMSLV